MAEPKLIERCTDSLGDYETWWMCQPPDDGERYRVIRDDWTTVRVIYEIEVAAP